MLLLLWAGLPPRYHRPCILGYEAGVLILTGIADPQDQFKESGGPILLAATPALVLLYNKGDLVITL